MTKILLIDDDEKLGELLTTFFERFDMNLVAATHPDEGLRQLEAAKPDLVILDVMLPGQDGFEVCRTIRRHANWWRGFKTFCAARRTAPALMDRSSSEI
jgi:OmpR family response regulator RpaB